MLFRKSTFIAKKKVFLQQEKYYEKRVKPRRWNYLKEMSHGQDMAQISPICLAGRSFLHCLREGVAVRCQHLAFLLEQKPIILAAKNSSMMFCVPKRRQFPKQFCSWNHGGKQQVDLMWLGSKGSGSSLPGHFFHLSMYLHTVSDATSPTW